jgi:hypothetical protein
VSPRDLVARWRADADRLEQLGLSAAATQARCYADELEETLRQAELEELPLSVAAAESGYSESQLRRRFPGQPTIRRAELPRKGGHGGPDLAGAVIAGTLSGPLHRRRA